MQRMKTKRAKRARARPRRAPQAQIPYHHLSHSSALIRDVLSGDEDSYTTLEAMALVSMLSSLTESMRAITYRHGFHTGRLVYSISEHGKGYKWHEDSMPDLVNFLERSGHKCVTYHVFPGDFWLRFGKGSQMDLGANVHAFEAGLISGFVSASRRHTIGATETTCAMSGHERCTFTTKSGEAGTAGKESIQRFVSRIATEARRKRGSPSVPAAYYSLASSVLFDGAYLDAIRQVISHIGAQLAERTITGKRKGIETAISTISLLGLGQPRLRKTSPIELDVSFKGRHARREQVDLSIAFISGLLNNLVAKNRELEATTLHSKGDYTLRIREVRSSSRK